MKKKIGWIKVAGIGAAIGGFILSMIGDWADEKEQEFLIEEKVDEAMQKWLFEEDDQAVCDNQEEFIETVETETTEES